LTINDVDEEDVDNLSNLHIEIGTAVGKGTGGGSTQLQKYSKGNNKGLSDNSSSGQGGSGNRH
jgi:hypothetical protein